MVSKASSIWCGLHCRCIDACMRIGKCACNILLCRSANCSTDQDAPDLCHSYQNRPLQSLFHRPDRLSHHRITEAATTGQGALRTPHTVHIPAAAAQGAMAQCSVTPCLCRQARLSHFANAQLAALPAAPLAAPLAAPPAAPPAAAVPPRLLAAAPP